MPGFLSDFAPTPSGWDALAEATAHLQTPYVVVDLGAMRANADAMVASAAGKPIRLATKSVRCREIARGVLSEPGFRGVLALTLAEAIWLVGQSEVDDVVVGYPSVDTESLQALNDDDVAARVTVMIDSVEHLDLIESAAGTGGPTIRVCLDIDASLRLLGGRVHLGTRRSPLHEPAAVVALAREVLERPRFALVGLMAYEAQIAGVGDDAGSLVRKAQIRGMQTVSARELRERRAAVVAAVREVTTLEFVNGGGTGSIAATAAEDAVTEIGAGSGLYCPTLFDGYRRLRLHPAAFFVTSVVRRPSAGFATVLGGGWVASGAAAPDRLPLPVWPASLALTALEGAGEAQTPVQGPGAQRLRTGDRVWFRHAKAGELCERVNTLHLVAGNTLVASVPTYRGEGHAFL